LSRGFFSLPIGFFLLTGLPLAGQDAARWDALNNRVS
jgi:hypothetical protein